MYMIDIMIGPKRRGCRERWNKREKRERIARKLKIDAIYIVIVFLFLLRDSIIGLIIIRYYTMFVSFILMKLFLVGSELFA